MRDDKLTTPLTTPIALISFDMMGDNITYEELETSYARTNLKFTRWITPVKLSNPTCVYVDKTLCQNIIPSDIESKQAEVDALNQIISEMESGVLGFTTRITEMETWYQKERATKKKEVEDANKPTFFSNNKKRLAKIAKETQEKLTGIDKTYSDKTKEATDALTKLDDVKAKKTSLDTQIRAISQPIGKLDIMNFGTDHVNPIFFIDSNSEMSKNRLLSLVADKCKNSKDAAAVAAVAAGGKCRKYTLRRRRNRGVKKTINKNKKNKKYSSIRIRRKYILRRNNTRRKL